MGPKWASWGVLGPLGGLLVLGGILEAVLGRLGGVLVANMAPTCPPKRSPNRSKIEAKINQFLNASWDRIFGGFWWILEIKKEASWHPDGIKIDANFERRYFEKASFFLRKNKVFKKKLAFEVGIDF